jgi:enediyne biosynthesis protein E4
MSDTSVASGPPTVWSRRRLVKRWLAGIGIAGLVYLAWGWWGDRQYQAAMDEIEGQILTGRYAQACRDLNALLAWRKDSNGGITYLLGSTELARGRKPAAREAWERVAPGVAFSEPAIRGRMRLYQESGKFAAAEELVTRASEDHRNERTAFLKLLVPMFSELGRIDEAVRLVELRWEYLNEQHEGALDPAIKLVGQHLELTLNPLQVENIRAVVEAAARLAPDDDRVWLGRANLAIRIAAHDEAERWLDACLRRRPEDIPVWRARLSQGLATHRLDVVRQAMTHIPAEASTPAEIHRLRAWLAAHRNDIATERQELERLRQDDPSDLGALDRLVQLAEKAGQPARAVELARERLEIDRLRARYVQLHQRKQPIRAAVELAHLAERLGRTFERRAFLTVAVYQDPGRHDLQHALRQLTPSSSTIHTGPRTLAEAVSDQAGDN